MTTITSGYSLRAALAVASVMVLGLGGLAGCSTQSLPERPDGDQFLVETVRLSHQVAFAGETDEIALAAPDQLLAFLDEVDPDGMADIYLDAEGPLRDRRLDEVAGLLRDLGREPAGAGGAVANDLGVTVTVADDIYLPTACMDSDQWPSANLPPANCTNALALVRMVEDPADLLRGRTPGPASAAAAAEAAARHRLRSNPRPEVPASAEDQQNQLPPPPLTEDASY